MAARHTDIVSMAFFG